MKLLKIKRAIFDKIDSIKLTLYEIVFINLGLAFALMILFLYQIYYCYKYLNRVVKLLPLISASKYTDLNDVCSMKRNKFNHIFIGGKQDEKLFETMT